MTDAFNPQLAPPWISDRELSAEEVDALKLLADKAVLPILDKHDIDPLTLDGIMAVQSLAIDVAEKMGWDDARARGLSIATEVAAINRKFS